jgi:hypothetical protein
MKKTFATILLLGTLAIAIAQTVSYDAWFTWTANPASELVTGYRIEYQKLPAVTNWTYITFVPSTTNSAVVKNLQPGYIYKFRAFAVNAIGTGTNQSAIVQLPVTSPTVVTNFSNTPR